MSKFDDYLDIEEDFQPRGKRESRKERRASSVRDRSKYKKTDQDQKAQQLRQEEPPLGANYKRLGDVDIQDHADAIRHLRERPYFEWIRPRVWCCSSWPNRRNCIRWCRATMRHSSKRLP